MARGERGAFYNTLEEFHKYWERIDIICPKSKGVARVGASHRAQIAIEHYGGGERQDHVFGNVFIHSSPWPLVFQPWWILKKGLEIYREQKFNLVTVHEYPPFYNGIGARMLWGKIRVPYILEIHHIVGYPKAADLKEKFYRWLTRVFVRYDSSKAKAVRTVNQKQVPGFLIKAGVPKEKIIYIPSLYIDLDIFRPMDPVRSSLAEVTTGLAPGASETSNGVNLEKKYDLIFVGRLVKNKGINLLFEAASKLKIQNPNFKLLIVGDGPLKENLKFKIENLKLKDNIQLYGWAENQEEIARLLNQSKILIIPSYNEGGPRVAIESMACGVPILATPVGVMADIIKDGQYELTITWDAKDIAEKIGALLDSRSKYEKYSRIGIEISRHFEKRAAIKNYALKLQESA